MSAEIRKRASQLADKFARVFDVPRERVLVEIREDDDAEVSSPDIDVVWSLSGRPYSKEIAK